MASLALSASGEAQAPDYQVPKPVYMKPFPVVRLSGQITLTGVRIKIMRITAPAGARVTVRCRGGKRLGCPFRSLSRISPYSGATRIRKIERRLKAGAFIRVLVRDGQTIGKYTSFKIRKRKVPKRNDACLLPGSTKPAVCP